MFRPFILISQINIKVQSGKKPLAGVRGKYYVPHIPHTLLVYPDGNFEPFNLWEENEINKLYALTGN